MRPAPALTAALVFASLSAVASPPPGAATTEGPNTSAVLSAGRVQSSAARDTSTLGQPVTYRITAGHQEGERVEVRVAEGGDWTVRQGSAETVEGRGPSPRETTVSVPVAFFRLGPVAPTAEVTVIGPRGSARHTVALPRVEVVEAFAGETELEDIVGPRPIFVWSPWRIAAVLVGGGLLVAAAALVLRRLRRPLSPEKEALRGLEALQADDRAEHDPAGWHFALAAVMRRYLERRLEIRAQVMTTPELSASLRETGMQEAERDELTSWFEQIDGVRFSGRSGPRGAPSPALAFARQFVRAHAPDTKGRPHDVA